MNFDRLFHFERFVPNLANNRELPEREQLTLEIATGLSVVELETFSKAHSQAIRDAKGTQPAEPGKLATPEELKAYVEAMKTELARIRVAQAEALAPLWAPYVRLAKGTHTVNGKPLATLADYLGLVLQQQGLFNFLEIPDAVRDFNSVSGSHALFSRALSGGSDSTGDRNSAEGTVAH